MLWYDSLSVVFRRLVQLCSFLACWRQANVSAVPKGPPSSSVSNNRPISITSVLSKVFERLVSVCLGWFMERSGVLPTTQFAYRKCLGTCDALLCVSHTLQSALEARIAQIDFSAAFDRINHQGILYKLCSVGIWGFVLSTLPPFLPNRSQRVKGTVFAVIRFLTFFLIIKNHYIIGNNVWKFQVSTMKIVPVARIWSSCVIRIIKTPCFCKGDNTW